jgi:hypothetical protein
MQQELVAFTDVERLEEYAVYIDLKDLTLE